MPGSAGLDALEGAELSLEPLWRFLGALRRRWWLVAFVAIGATVIGTYEVARRPVVYRAVSTLLLQTRPHVVDRVTAVSSEDSTDLDRFANSQVHILMSERMAVQVARRMHVPAGSLGVPIAVTVDKASELITLTVDDVDAEKARALVNAYTETYIAFTISDHSELATDAAEFLGGESKAHREHLENDERGLYAFQRSNGLPASNFEESHRIYATTLQSLHAQAAVTFGLGVKLRAELEQLHAAKDNRELRRRLSLSTSTGTWADLHQRYLALIEQAALLESRYGPKHPKLLETQEALVAVGTALDHEVATGEAALESRARANASEQAQLKSAISTETSKALDLRQKELEYNRLKRHLDEDRESYDLVAKRQKELEIQAGLKQSYVRRLDASAVASPLPRPIARATLLGLVVGLLLGCGLAFGLDVLDDTLRAPTEVESRMQTPLLGFVADFGANKGEPKAVDQSRASFIVTNPRSVIAEQCHSVATNVYSLFLEQPPRTLAVVSAASHDGKTLTCVNLAATLSARGKRVLLVDADLRRGRMHTLFQIPRAGGVFELAAGQVEIDQAIRRTFIPNVDVISCGEVPEKVSPARVLELSRLREVFGVLRERYDLVLFDTPPLPMVSDVLLLKDLFDGVLGVFRAGETSTRLGAEMQRQLRSANVNFLGWVLNGVAKADLKSRYYRRYYATYGAYERDPADPGA